MDIETIRTDLERAKKEADELLIDSLGLLIKGGMRVTPNDLISDDVVMLVKPEIYEKLVKKLGIQKTAKEYR